MTKRLSEFSLIKKYFAPLAGEGSFGLLDDAATVSASPGHQLVVTQDACAEGIHFFPDDPPELIAKKALRVNLSDLAAKGAVPLSFSLALGIGKRCDEAWIKTFASGLEADIEEYGIRLSGGDTFRTGAGTVISITAIGETPQGCYVSRLGAREGDRIFVTGTIGDAALGLQARLGNLNYPDFNPEPLVDRYLLPQPRTGHSVMVREFASASMDISDGLVGDLQKLCQASGVGASLFVDKVPVSKAAAQVLSLESKWLETAVTGGDDYEILFTVPQAKLAEFRTKTSAARGVVTCVGEISSGEDVTVFDKNRESIEFAKAGYTHTGD